MGGPSKGVGSLIRRGTKIGVVSLTASPTVPKTRLRLPFRTVVSRTPACYGEFGDAELETVVLATYFDCCRREEMHPDCERDLRP